MTEAANPSYSKIVATGRAVPAQYSTNREIEERCGLDPGWIEQRTGILKRPLLDEGQSVSDLARKAAENALAKWENGTGDRNHLGMLILATSTPDHLLPPTAPLVASQLELGNIPAFDIAVACSGFLYALQLADGFCRTNRQPALVIAANVLSRRVAANDPSTAALFADGGGAAVIATSETPGLLAISLESDGSGYDSLKVPHGGSKHPIDATTLENELHKMQVNNGMAVFRYAVESMSRLGLEVLRKSNTSIEEVDLWIPHQANLRIIESARQKIGIPESKTGITIDRFANSSAATIPLALDYFIEQERVRDRSLVLLTAAAAGLTSGAALVRM